jgi:hypothetical protein
LDKKYPYLVLAVVAESIPHGDKLKEMIITVEDSKSMRKQQVLREGRIDHLAFSKQTIG